MTIGEEGREDCGIGNAIGDGDVGTGTANGAR